MENEINYDKLVEKALKHVVIEALKIAAEEGLPGENHFYISFKTNHPDVRMDSALLDQYPEDMTIVLQHQFANLMLSENYFEVDLSFNSIPHTLRIPYESITYFADPHARFALSFANAETVKPLHEDQAVQKVSGGTAEIVSIDNFRKKK
ncbi:MAG: ClpXP protease specificity-enhancing factor SspB [Alphaproteobacteria bacterium]|nr:ClpXP protease specificity-enhancing factor SspB [Alphaproteobacteria bacterium]